MEKDTMRRFGNRPAGLTLIELLIVIAMIAILSAIGIPGLLGGIKRSGADGASRSLADTIRLTQATALTRGVQARLIVFDQAGVVPMTPMNLIDATKANRYRIETRRSASASWPALTDDPSTNPNVVTPWSDLGSEYGGVVVTSGSAVIFNSIGGLLNATVPATLVIQGPSGSKTVQTNLIGKATIL